MATTFAGADAYFKQLDDIEVREHLILASPYMLVKDGETVRAGEPLISGPLNPHDILHIRGKDDLEVAVLGAGLGHQDASIALIHRGGNRPQAGRTPARP